MLNRQELESRDTPSEALRIVPKMNINAYQANN